MSKLSIFTLSALLIWVTNNQAADIIIPSPISKALQATPKPVIRGQLRAREFTVIAAGMSGKLLDFPVTHGQRIKQGQKIASFNCKIAHADKDVVIAKLNAAKSKLATNKALEQYRNISQLDVILSESEVNIQQAELARIKAVLSECQVKAPFSGIVTEKIAQAHQFIKEGEPMLELVNTSSLELEMVLNSSDLVKFPIGTRFTIKLDEFSKPVSAKIARNIGMIDPISQTIRVIATLLKPPRNLLPGMSGVIKFSQAAPTKKP